MARIKYFNTTTQEWEYADGLSGGGGIPDAPTDLQDLQSKTIADTAGYFTTDTVEGALAEIGGTLDGLEAAINTIRGIS